MYRHDPYRVEPKRACDDEAYVELRKTWYAVLTAVQGYHFRSGRRCGPSFDASGEVDEEVLNRLCGATGERIIAGMTMSDGEKRLQQVWKWVMLGGDGVPGDLPDPMSKAKRRRQRRHFTKKYLREKKIL